MKISFHFTILAAYNQLMQPTMSTAESSTSRLRSSRGRLQESTKTSVLPEGIWTCRGYGYTVRAKDNEMTLFHETKNSCILDKEGITYDDVQQIVIDDNTVATVTIPGKLSPIKCDRTDTFQYGCASGITPTLGDAEYKRNPVTDFDILVETFAEHYAFFEQRDIDWKESTSIARATLNTNSSDEELQQAFISILDPLDDGHVAVASDDGSFYFSPETTPLHEMLAQEFSNQAAYDDLEGYIQSQFMTWIEIISTYMDDDGLNGMPGQLLWGRSRDGNVAYMQIFAFAPYNPYNPHAFTESLNTAFLALKDTDAIVVDIRVNGGGIDSYALQVASHFASERTHVLSKMAVNGEGYTDLYQVYLEPSDPSLRYDGKVIVIASGTTASAAEIFAMTLKQLPQTLLLGRPTAGALSDVLEKRLPNNWAFGLSNEQYLTPDGTLYEIVGVPPDLRPKADLLPLSEREAFVDTWLEEAFDYATREQE